jgi:acetate kinase
VPALGAIDAVLAQAPNVPQLAAFDSAFHATLSPAAAGYALPFDWTERWGLRRFGFHGLSVEHATRRAEEVTGRVVPRLVVFHAGNGCSVTAVAQGRSIDTTMGFTALEGLVMGTRSGSVDPGLLLHLQLERGVAPAELLDTLTNRSGLLGVSGVSADLRDVLHAADAGSPRATLAYELFIRAAKRAIGAMIAVLGGLDVLVFTGGIGEHIGRVRRDVTAGLAYAGLTLDEEKNQSSVPDGDIAARESPARILVIQAREDLVILRAMVRRAAA